MINYYVKLAKYKLDNYINVKIANLQVALIQIDYVKIAIFNSILIKISIIFIQIKTKIYSALFVKYIFNYKKQ